MAAQTSLNWNSRFKFGTYLAYSPRGKAEVSRRSRELCYAVKQDAGGAIARVVARLVEGFSTTNLTEVLGPDVVLVPAPRSAPLLERALWPARRIADELVTHGLGAEVLVTRTTPVMKSATASPGERTTVAGHIDSLRLEPLLADPKKLTIVDDVMTRGRMAFAMAMLLAARFPGIEVRAFALLRTLGFQPEIEKIDEPCIGVLVQQRGDVNRLDEPPPDSSSTQGKLF